MSINSCMCITLLIIFSVSIPEFLFLKFNLIELNISAQWFWPTKTLCSFIGVRLDYLLYFGIFLENETFCETKKQKQKNFGTGQECLYSQAY